MKLLRASCWKLDVGRPVAAGTAAAQNLEKLTRQLSTGVMQ